MKQEFNPTMRHPVSVLDRKMQDEFGNKVFRAAVDMYVCLVLGIDPEHLRQFNERAAQSARRK